MVDWTSQYDGRGVSVPDPVKIGAVVERLREMAPAAADSGISVEQAIEELFGPEALKQLEKG